MHYQQQINEKEEVQKKERAILVGVEFSSNSYESSSDETMEELESLLKTAGGETVGRVVQKLDTPHSATFIGKGKTEELAEIVAELGADLVIFDNELSPTQVRNLEEETKTRVIDRSQLILDIFAMRATTREGRLQVELAQYKYMLPRLSFSYEALSKLGGGIGIRGPGEAKLETDRRHISRRIQAIERELKDVVKTRQTQRQMRQKSAIPVIAIIGYTNAGKSTLFNRLTNETVFVEDTLFATLETTTRKTILGEEQQVLFTDTVGFIRNLSHHLVEAFKSTLEEVRYSDLLLHVVDYTDANREAQMEVADKLLHELGAGGIPRILVWNKCDGAASGIRQDKSCCISAKTGGNMEVLSSLIIEKLNENKREMRVHIPYSRAALLHSIHKDGEVMEEVYEEEHIKVHLRCDAILAAKLMEFSV